VSIEQLQGTWHVVSVEVEGQKFPPGDSRIVIAGARFVSLGMGAEFEGTVEIGEKTFDLRFDKGPHAGKASLGIYELSGDQWKMCLGLAGKRRPEQFVSKPGTGHALQILRREKETPTPAADETNTGQPTELEGEWGMTSCIQDGRPMSKSFAKMARRLFAGDRTTLFIGEQVSAQSRVRVNAGEIDYLDSAQAGIYELSTGRLKIAMGERGAPRPADFSATPGDGRTVTEWKLRR
jgi:uncharacterized protein (TIGR03067 family)